MLRSRPYAWSLALILVPASAAAETPQADQPAPPQPPAAQAPQPQPPPAVYPQPQQPQQPQPGAYPQPNPVYGQPPPGYAQPGYPPQGYPPPVYGQPPYGYGYGQQGYGYVPQGPPPPPPPPKPEPLRWSLRFDPFDLVQRRMSFQGEVAIAGPFAIEATGSWIFGSPYSGFDKKGFAIGGNAVFYLSGTPLRGMWLKAHGEYESFTATYANGYDPTLVSAPERFGSGVFGVLFGDTFVIPRSGGFALSGGIGVGVATHPTATITAPGRPGVTPTDTVTLYDGFDRVRLLGSIGLGVAF